MSWIRVEKVREVKGILNGKIIAVLDLQAATADDLPATGDVVENYIIAAGSCAQLVRASSLTFVTLDGDDGNWYPEQPSESASAASQLSLGKTVVKPAVIQPDELEQTEAEPTEEPQEVTEDAELL